MKTVFLLAGVGRRLGELTERQHKSLIPLQGKPLLGHLLQRFVDVGQREVVPIVGHLSDDVLHYVKETYGDRLEVKAVLNPKYDETNNLYSLYCAQEVLRGKPFVLCNGDAILSGSIIKAMLELPESQSAIALDMERCREVIDSPGTIVREGRIYDLGRHVRLEENGGYAIGLYKFNAELSEAFFAEAERMFAKGRYNAGFHDPLITLFEEYAVTALPVNGAAWTDIDTAEDIPKADKIMGEIILQEK